MTENAKSSKAAEEFGEKSFLAAWALSLFLGVIGVDRFYLGKVGTGILKLLTIGGFGIWYLIDLILILANVTKDKEGKKLQGYDEKNNKMIAIGTTIGFYVLTSITGTITATVAMKELAPAIEKSVQQVIDYDKEKNNNSGSSSKSIYDYIFDTSNLED